MRCDGNSNEVVHPTLKSAVFTQCDKYQHNKTLGSDDNIVHLSVGCKRSFTVSLYLSESGLDVFGGT